jgi:uncharacterized membrane protein
MGAEKVPVKNENAKTRLPLIITSSVLAASVILIIIMNLRAPVGYTMYNSDTITYEKGKVVDVLEEQLQPADGMPGRELGRQTIRVQFRNGPMKGQEIEIVNNLSTTHNINVRPGQLVVVKADRPEGITPYYTLYSYDRTSGLLVVSAIFVALMLLIGRFKGLRSVLGLGISLFFIFAFLVPAVYRGWSPVWMSILTVIVISAFSILLLNGFGIKTLVAVTAATVGVAVSALFFFIISAALRLVGYDISEAEELILISQNTGLHIGEVLFAGVLVASLGAVMDTTVSVAAALYEMKEAQPGIARRVLFKSGMEIGRDIIGANCQTLILAFVGSSLATLLVLVSYGTQFDQFLSSNYLAVEVVHGMAGSIAVILAVPVTAGLCMFFVSRDKVLKRKQGKAAKQTGLAGRTFLYIGFVFYEEGGGFQ